MTTPDFRALCAELIQQLQELHTMVWGEAPHLLDEDRGGSAYLDLNIEDVLEKARTALATPPPEPPTDDELYDYWISTSPQFGCADPVGFARAVLERWGK
jgi:hypothetical protein